MAVVVDRLVELFGQGPVLEAGVGTGRFAIPLRARGVRVVGVDVAPKMLALAAGKGAADLFLGDAACLPFRDRSFSSSFAIHVLHLLANWRDVLHEMRRVTRDRFVTLHERIQTHPVGGGETTTAYGDAVAFPMGRYQELVGARGHGYTHPGVRTPDLIDRAAPDLRIAVGTHRLIIPAEDLLAPIAAKTHSSQWAVPDAVHREAIDVLGARSPGVRSSGRGTWRSSRGGRTSFTASDCYMYAEAACAGGGSADRPRAGLSAMLERPKPVVPTCPSLEATTLWDFSHQGVDGLRLGDPAYPGVTPALACVNVIRKCTAKGDLVVDPMCGSGTTVDAARLLGRRALGFDLAPRRPDILPADARALPLPAGCAHLVFVDPPYSDNIRYSDDPRCLGRLPAPEPAYYEAVESVAKEACRVLRPGGALA